jgi:uncharacterized Zn-finger protein
MKNIYLGKRFMRSDHLTKHVRTHIGASQQKQTNSPPVRAEIVGNLVLQADERAQFKTEQI